MTIRTKAAALPLAIAAAAFATAATAQQPPIKIGLSVSLTGGVAVNGKQVLLSMQIWKDDTNAKGGLMGRPVELDLLRRPEQPDDVPGIYTKLIEIDKVDLCVGPYATNMVVPAIPVLMQHNMVTLGITALLANREFHYNQYFSMVAWGRSQIAVAGGFFRMALQQNPKPETVAITCRRCRVHQVSADAAREEAKRVGLKIVYDKSYPPSTTDYAPVIRAVNATNPDIVYNASYPPDTIGMLHAADEVGLKTKMFGGNMIGLVSTTFKVQLGPLLNGVISTADQYVPGPNFDFPGVAELLKKYPERAAKEGLDPLGYNFAPYSYGALQILARAVEATKGFDQDKIGAYIHANEFDTVAGKISFGPDGEWAKSRVLVSQFQHVKGHDVDEFRDFSKQVVVDPPEYKAGDPIYRYSEDRKPCRKDPGGPRPRHRGPARDPQPRRLAPARRRYRLRRFRRDAMGRGRNHGFGRHQFGEGPRRDRRRSSAGPSTRRRSTGGICHFAGLPHHRVERRHGDRHVLSAYPGAADRGRAGLGAQSRQRQGLPPVPRRLEPLGSGAHQGRAGRSSIACRARSTARSRRAKSCAARSNGGWARPGDDRDARSSSAARSAGSSPPICCAAPAGTSRCLSAASRIWRGAAPASARARICSPSCGGSASRSIRRRASRSPRASASTSSGAIIHERVVPAVNSAWDRIYRPLKDALPASCYRAGARLSRARAGRGGVTALFADGTRESGRSADRRRRHPFDRARDAVLPGMEPRYAGYIAWRGALEESDLPPDDPRAALRPFHFRPARGRADPRSADARPRRAASGRFHWVWFRAADFERELPLLCTDASGQMPRRRPSRRRSSAPR